LVTAEVNKVIDLLYYVAINNDVGYGCAPEPVFYGFRSSRSDPVHINEW